MGVSLLCLVEGETHKVIKDFHGGVCGGHYSWNTAAHNSLKSRILLAYIVWECSFPGQVVSEVPSVCWETKAFSSSPDSSTCGRTFQTVGTRFHRINKHVVQWPTQGDIEGHILFHQVSRGHPSQKFYRLSGNHIYGGEHIISFLLSLQNHHI